MKKLYWVFLAALALIGLVMSIYLGLQPKAVPIIKYSNFHSSEHFSQALLQRLRLETEKAQVLFVGIWPEEKFEYELWAAFIKTNQEPGFKYDYVVIDNSLPFKELIPTNQFIDLTGGEEMFLTGLKNIIAEKKRVLFILPAPAATTKLENSALSMIGKKLDYPGFTFTTSYFPRNHGEENSKLPLPCGNETSDSASPLGCFILTAARSNYRQKNPEGKMEGLVQQIGAKEYLILINPGKSL